MICIGIGVVICIGIGIGIPCGAGSLFNVFCDIDTDKEREERIISPREINLRDGLSRISHFTESVTHVFCVSPKSMM